nr:biotin--[acetyl-CoA-carboxylase] ligase [Thiomonas sp.]
MTAPPSRPADDPQHAQALQAALAAQNLRCAVAWTPETASTNADLLERVRSGNCALDPQLRVAGHQTAGRGRQGRPWLDGKRDGSLLCSLAWPFAPGTPIAGLSVAVGVWLAQNLHALGASGAQLKWPNDVLLQNRKLAGILVELADTAQARWAVIGIGLNLQTPPEWPEAVGLDACGLRTSRWDMLRLLAPAMLAGLPIYAQTGFSPWAEAWNRLHAWRGESVAVLDHGERHTTGLALGVDDQGCLLLQTPQGLRRVASGDVSLRRAADLRTTTPS